MIINSISIIAVIAILVIAAIIILKYTKKVDSKISFKETFDLIGLPIVTFYSGNIKLNFILDTGSTSSFIDKALLGLLETEKAEVNKDAVIGMEGNYNDCEYHRLKITYKNIIFEETFGFCSMKGLELLNEEFKIKIHGILGGDFFERRKYIINFKDLIAYIK